MAYLATGSIDRLYKIRRLRINVWKRRNAIAKCGSFRSYYTDNKYDPSFDADHDYVFGGSRFGDYFYHCAAGHKLPDGSYVMEVCQKKSGANRCPDHAWASSCYIATAVYGSYDCPQVWVLRRYRDKTLSANLFGRVFIKAYYAIAPAMIKLFGKTKWFNHFFRTVLDRLVERLKAKGFSDSGYIDGL